MLTDKDAHVRLAAVKAAGLIGRDDVLPQLLDTLDDPSVTVRAEAAWSLGLLGNPEAVPYLEKATEDPTDGHPPGGSRLVSPMSPMTARP